MFLLDIQTLLRNKKCTFKDTVFIGFLFLIYGTYVLAANFPIIIVPKCNVCIYKRSPS